jgi:hypothetical protein
MPNRTLKESIRESESIDMLTPEAECTWYRLITYVDDYGLFKANARLINRALFPLRDHSDDDVAAWIDEIAAAGMVEFYLGSDKKPYGRIINWTDFNTPRNSKSKYPQMPADASVYTHLHEIENICKQLHANENNCMQADAIENKCPRSSSSSRSRSRGSTDPANNCTQKNPPGRYPPPSLQEVTEYFKANGYTAEAARKAFDYYEAGKDHHSGNWKDSKGKVVKAWKQKMQGVWFKPENRAPPDQPPPGEFDREAELRAQEEALK